MEFDNRSTITFNLLEAVRLHTEEVTIREWKSGVEVRKYRATLYRTYKNGESVFMVRPFNTNPGIGDWPLPPVVAIRPTGLKRADLDVFFQRR